MAEPALKAQHRVTPGQSGFSPIQVIWSSVIPVQKRGFDLSSNHQECLRQLCSPSTPGLRGGVNCSVLLASAPAVPGDAISPVQWARVFLNSRSISICHLSVLTPFFFNVLLAAFHCLPSSSRRLHTNVVTNGANRPVVHVQFTGPNVAVD